MPLPHFSNIKTATSLEEVVFPNLYEVNIVLPKSITDAGSVSDDYQNILLENCTNAKFPTYPTIETAMQRFKYSTRLYMKMPTSTSVEDLGLSFNVNQTDKKVISTFKIIKTWYDQVWNNEDGSLHYKRNITGEIIVFAHDKEGHVIRKVVYHNAQIKGFTGWEELAWESNDIVKLGATFASDYWEDFYY